MRSEYVAIMAFSLGTFGSDVVNMQIIKEIPGGECKRYQEIGYIEEAINDLHVFEQYSDILGYTKVRYADDEFPLQEDPKHIIKEICTTKAGEMSISAKRYNEARFDNNKEVRRPGCEYPYLNTTIKKTVYPLVKEDKFLEYKSCLRGEICLTSIYFVGLEVGETRDRPIENKCTFSIYSPARPVRL
ncbi:hypothetical protein AX774_g7100 [Zancudomyces culisetae]|uniref:Uncharacterized protein n=1 Tax=Zancudomyces culisetae TaxID=1213189 RepID=A0A1R1PEV7_ZANCU|nr:hypothetical protein AX774_g7100 [Zancudomyces culisetae]|eukprot:OMH79486.1 hypothetical protein AX774_g7100 [Zancudomyces culisetae]